jgi:hypothetical protein
MPVIPVLEVLPVFAVTPVPPVYPGDPTNPSSKLVADPPPTALSMETLKLPVVLLMEVIKPSI